MTHASPRPRLLITAPFDPAAAARLAELFEVETVEPSMEGASLARPQLADRLAVADAVVCEVDQVDQAALDAAPALKFVVTCRASPVNVDLPACTRRGIPVATTPARNAEITADLAFTLILSAVRRTGAAERWMRDGNWRADDVFEPYARFRGIGLGGRTLGILGGGAIGRRVMRRALGFGMNVLVHDPFLAPGALGDDAEIVGLDDLMGRSDVITVHVPLNDSTVGLVGAREIALMRPDAYLVNAGRAAVVDEEALMAALREKRIGGAGLDVFWTEPPPADSELFRLDNVTLTPHIGGASDDVVTEHSRIAERALRAWAVGEEPAAVANAGPLAAV
ncbi:hydroxyacid dehydrogenase [Streptomyces uncialis]|uniref:NAD(P)-dependent oxidoreductase n=1 Tax=Streptomyces uncialis TaxID=1048205 RepID=UPI002E2EE2C6|nr:NAD(P)-dependent oxidoreductase [Streptomyces uncialis]